MLLNDKIEIKITRSNLPHYAAKGYDAHPGIKIQVSLPDVAPYCETGVDLTCDRCGIAMRMSAGSCLRNLNEWGKFYCRDCKMILRTGYPPLNGCFDDWFRLKSKQWRIDSLKEHNYRCVITGAPSTVIHHPFPLRKIIFETFESLGVKKIRPGIHKYDWMDRDKIARRCLKIHYKHGLGVCLTKELHWEFHHLYGMDNFTPEDFEEFKAFKLGKEYVCQ